ncbi:MAG: nucleotidyl transferase AbiEii/AbiGii toxin family protein, partial [Bdellovibrionota bacterium]
LANTVVEKDYALGWLLWGINQHPRSKEWIFKGGTCLKKCYFETYRFSEDLDFSILGSTQPSAEELTTLMAEVCDSIYEASGLEFPKASIEFDIFKNPRGSTSIQGGLKYRGPVRPQIGIANMPRIKIDLTLDEPLILPPATKSVDHPYSDIPEDGISISAYSYEEIFAEKVRALAQRLRPRDLYDVIHLHRRLDLNPNRVLVRSTLESKCTLRGIPVPTLASLQSHEHRQSLESEWETQLKHQIPVLPAFESFLAELPSVLDWLEEGTVEELQAIAVVGETETSIVREAVANIGGSAIGGSYLDRIRFAAASRLVVRLGYGGKFRTIEPYSLARSSDGNLLLRAVRTDNRETRSYRWDRIESILVTDRSFKPTYAIEI